jgi:hypothetical protein
LRVSTACRSDEAVSGVNGDLGWLERDRSHAGAVWSV